MKSAILNFLLLVLGVSLKLAPNVVDKSPEIAKIFPKKVLKFNPKTTALLVCSGCGTYIDASGN